MARSRQTAADRGDGQDDDTGHCPVGDLDEPVDAGAGGGGGGGSPAASVPGWRGGGLARGGWLSGWDSSRSRGSARWGAGCGGAAWLWELARGWAPSPSFACWTPCRGRARSGATRMAIGCGTAPHRCYRLGGLVGAPVAGPVAGRRPDQPGSVVTRTTRRLDRGRRTRRPHPPGRRPLRGGARDLPAALEGTTGQGPPAGRQSRPPAAGGAAAVVLWVLQARAAVPGSAGCRRRTVAIRQPNGAQWASRRRCDAPRTAMWPCAPDDDVEELR